MTPYCYSMISILLIISQLILMQKRHGHFHIHLSDTNTDISVLRFMQNYNHTPGKLDLERTIYF